STDVATLEKPDLRQVVVTETSTSRHVEIVFANMSKLEEASQFLHLRCLVGHGGSQRFPSSNWKLCSFGTSRSERVVPEPRAFIGLARPSPLRYQFKGSKQSVEHFCSLVFRGVAVSLAHCRRAPSITLAAEIDATI